MSDQTSLSAGYNYNTKLIVHHKVRRDITNGNLRQMCRQINGENTQVCSSCVSLSNKSLSNKKEAITEKPFDI